ncbi:hypothetical protein CR513_03801, partial [Mucuna pruriens]
MVDQVEERAQTSREEAKFWKDRYVKLAWLANQAIVDIPRSLRATEGMMFELLTRGAAVSMAATTKGRLSTHLGTLHLSMPTSPLLNALRVEHQR